MPAIRIGFVGLSTEGWAADSLVNPLLRPPLSDEYTLTSLSTRFPKSALEASNKYTELTKHNVKSFHGDVSQIAGDTDLDLIAVAIRSPSHRQAAMPIIDAGKDIFVEWPCGRGIQDAKEMMDAAQRKGVKTMVGLQGRQCLVSKKAKELVSAGKIGRVLSTSVLLSVPKELNYWGPLVAERFAYTVDENNGATMLDIGVGHFLDTLTRVLGDFASVTATTRTQYEKATEVDEEENPTGQILMQTSANQVAFSGVLQSGAVVSVHCRGGHPSTKGRTPFIWVIDGEEGSIRMDSDNPRGSFIPILAPALYLNGEEVKVGDGEDELGNIGRAWQEFAKGPGGDYPSFEDAVKVHHVLDAVARSAKEGKRINLEYS